MIRNRDISAIIFDLIGTLAFQSVGYEHHILKAFEAYENLEVEKKDFLKTWLSVEEKYSSDSALGLELLKEGKYREAMFPLREVNFLEKVEQILKRLGKYSTSETKKTIQDGFQKSWFANLSLPENVFGMIDKLSKKFTLGLVSNFQDANLLRKWLDEVGLSGYFKQYVVISDEVGVRKPHPLLHELMQVKLNIESSTNILYVGDNLVEDVYGPSYLGMQVILINNLSDMKNEKDRITKIPNILELKKILL